MPRLKRYVVPCNEHNVVTTYFNHGIFELPENGVIVLIEEAQYFGTGWSQNSNVTEGVYQTTIDNARPIPVVFPQSFRGVDFVVTDVTDYICPQGVYDLVVLTAHGSSHVQEFIVHVWHP